MQMQTRSRRGSEYKTGFIAQEVELVLPECVGIGSGYIPDIMTSLAVSLVSDDVYTMDADAAGFVLQEGEVIKCRSNAASPTAFYGYVLGSGVAGVHNVRFARAVGDMSSVFVVGRHINDLKLLNFSTDDGDHDRRIQSQEARIQSQEARIQSQEARIQSQEARIQSQEARIAALEVRP
jgi:hypothetical protein